MWVGVLSLVGRFAQHRPVRYSRDMTTNTTTMRITARQAEDIEYKLDIMADEPDMLETYGLTEEQGRALVDSVPARGGEWDIPAWAIDAVAGELADLADVWRDIARSVGGGFAITAAEDDARRRESRAIARDARAIERIAGVVGGS